MSELIDYFDQRIPVISALGFDANKIDRLREYVEELWQANEQLNLISRKMTFAELIDNHVIDCLLPLKEWPMDAKVVADFGAGGGLPGVIYALQFPNTRFRLYEKSRLKQEFLRHCKTIAPNLEILGEVPSQLGDVDFVVSRAFKSIDVILDISRNYFQKGGRYFLLKARLGKINEELLDAQKKFKGLKSKVVPLKSPVLEVERHLLWINP